MKRFTLLMVFLSIMAVSFGQVLKTAQDAPMKQERAAYFEGVNPGFTKGSGDVIWQTSFNWADPTQQRGWSLPEGWTVGDNTDLGNEWVWRLDTVKGQFTTEIAPATFLTPKDGFICLPMDEYNYRDGISTNNLADTWIETPPIDCSNAASVVVKFCQKFRLCCSDYNLQMLVTNDGGVHWATYDVRCNVSGNITTPTKNQTMEINISDVAAGLNAVQIRFYMHGMADYYWMIDDLRLCEAYENDLVLEDYWLDFDGGEGASLEHINCWPLSQMGMAGTVSGTVGSLGLKAAILNNGSADAEGAKLDMQILKNGVEFDRLSSPGADIWTLERDTEKIANPFIASDYGTYRFNYNIVANKEDEIPANNTNSLDFVVNDTLGQRADFSVETSVNSGGWVDGGLAGDMMGLDYTLYKAAEINGISAYLSSFTANQAPQFQYVLMKIIDENAEEWMTSDVVEMDSSLLGSWVTLPLMKDGETEFLEPGKYATLVRSWGTNPSTGAGTCGMSIGRDLTTKFNTYCRMWYTKDGAWHNPSGYPLPVVGFVLNSTGGPTQAPITFNVNMTKHIASGQFVPGTDVVTVMGIDGVWTSSATLTDPDGDGTYSVTVEGFPVGQYIHYKFAINGNPEAYPTSGYYHYRRFMVRYWNTISVNFNNGVTTGVDTRNLTASFSVYPNPTAGAFTVSITNDQTADLIISMTNIQGQVVYQKNVKNVSNYQENIDNQFAKGLYFLSVNNGKEVKVQKVVIQ